jgi:hypothetical protein
MNEFIGETTQSGITMLPKRIGDVSTYEIARFLKYTGDAVEYVTFHVPRKEGGTNGKTALFQEDVYAPMPSGKPSGTAEEWFNSTESEHTPDLTSIKPPTMKSIYETPESEGGKRRTESISDTTSAPQPTVVINTNSNNNDGIRYDSVYSAYVSVLEDEFGRDQYQKHFMALCTATTSKSNRIFIAYGNDSNNIIHSKTSRFIELDQVIAIQRCKQLRDLNFTDDQCFELFVQPENPKEGEPTLRVLTVACQNRQDASQWLDTLNKRLGDPTKKKKKPTIYQDFILELVSANGDDVPVSYWAKRWVVALPDQLLVFNQRKSFHPKGHYATVKKKHEYTGPLLKVESMDLVDSAPDIILSKDEKRLCFKLVLNNQSERYMLFTNDIQKELWIEDVQTKIGQLIRKKSDNDNDDVQILLKSLGLFDADSNKNNDDDSDDEEGGGGGGKQQNSFMSRLREEEKQAVEDAPGQVEVYPISQGMTDDDIQSLFSAFGEVTNVELHREGKFKDRAIVTYQKRSESLEALALNGAVLDAEKIIVEAIAATDMRNPGYLKSK